MAAAMRALHLRVFERTFCQNVPIDAPHPASVWGSSGFIVFWILAIIITAVACAALYYAARGRPVNAGEPLIPDLTTAHFRQRLAEIDADIATRRLGQPEAQAARAELARELLQLEREAQGRPASGAGRTPLLPLSLLLVAVVALGAYGVLGSPQLPARPLATRPDVPPLGIDLDDAIARIEAQLAQTPDDLRGWTVIAPAYMQLGRFADAERAFRRIIALAGATADNETDLGEALMMANGGVATGAPLDLFRSAAARDPQHVRSRYYLAGEATRTGDYANAVKLWNELLGLAAGDESWVATAQQGLAAATAGLGGATAPDAAAIAAMVAGLEQRLTTSGGSIEEWTQLVRSHLVLGQGAAAQAAYEAARKAYPDAATRRALDVLAADSGLSTQEVTD